VKDSIYFKQAELLLRVLPFIDREAVFSLKGGTAINFFVRDLPRISVDIDLVYLPIRERDVSLGDISSALVRISQGIGSKIPETMISSRKIRGTDFLKGLIVRRQEATVKIEPNLVMRGSVFPTERKNLSKKAQNLFELSVESRILLADELYAGKICATLDRQHPRDFFDVHMLFKNEGIHTAMRKAFIVYLISHPRPMVEILNPRFRDIRPVFEKEFAGMTFENVTCEDLIKTREQLVTAIKMGLTLDERQFIVSVKEGNPQWELLGIEGIENLPAVKWKLLNIEEMDPSKHKKAVRKLRNYLEV